MHKSSRSTSFPGWETTGFQRHAWKKMNFPVGETSASYLKTFWISWNPDWLIEFWYHNIAGRDFTTKKTPWIHTHTHKNYHVPWKMVLGRLVLFWVLAQGANCYQQTMTHWSTDQPLKTIQVSQSCPIKLFLFKPETYSCQTVKGRRTLCKFNVGWSSKRNKSFN